MIRGQANQKCNDETAFVRASRLTAECVPAGSFVCTRRPGRPPRVPAAGLYFPVSGESRTKSAAASSPFLRTRRASLPARRVIDLTARKGVEGKKIGNLLTRLVGRAILRIRCQTKRIQQGTKSAPWSHPSAENIRVKALCGIVTTGPIFFVPTDRRQHRLSDPFGPTHREPKQTGEPPYGAGPQPASGMARFASAARRRGSLANTPPTHRAGQAGQISRREAGGSKTHRGMGMGAVRQ